MMKECKHKNIVAYLGTYHRSVPSFLDLLDWLVDSGI